MSGIQPDGPPKPMSRQGRRWAELAVKRETEALPTIRGLAEKWAASLTAALGVVGLTGLIDKSETFSKLESGWKTVAEVSFVLATVLGLVATALAILAAQGSAKRYFLAGGSALKQYSKEAVDTVLTLLKWSRIVAGLAAACILIAGGCLWFGDRAAGKPTAIELPAGSQLCQGAAPSPESSEADFEVFCGKKE